MRKAQRRNTNAGAAADVRLLRNELSFGTMNLRLAGSLIRGATPPWSPLAFNAQEMKFRKTQCSLITPSLNGNITLVAIRFTIFVFVRVETSATCFPVMRVYGIVK